MTSQEIQSTFLMLVALFGFLTTICVPVQGAVTTASSSRTFATLIDVNNVTKVADTDDLSSSTTNLTTLSTNEEFGSKTSPAATKITAVTTATTVPLRFLRTNRTRLTRGTTTSKITTSLPSLHVGSSTSLDKKVTATGSFPMKSKGGRRQRYDRPEDTERYSFGVGHNPNYYSHSKTMSYSSSTGSRPRFSSSEEYFHLPLDEVLGSESEINSHVDHFQPATKRSSSGEIKGNRQDCRMVHKPMPDYLEYSGGGGGGGGRGRKGSSDHGKHKPMMTCYVCGKRDEPFSNGGYTEDCDVSPTNQKDTYVNRDGSYRENDDYDNTPNAKATKSHGKLYAGNGQSPYLTGAEKNVASDTSGNVNVRDDYDPYYGNDDDGYYGGERGGGGGGGDDGYGSGGYPEATDSSGAVYDSNDNDGGSSRGYDDGAETDKSSCKIVYKGKMKCRVCGDPKQGGAFDEQCDYEADSPEQHHSRAYDYSSNNEKKYRSKPHSGGSRGGGGGGGGRGHYDDDDSYRGYEDDGYYGSENYPRYDNYGTGTGFDPYYDNTGPTYDDGNTDYQQRNGRDSKEQPEASTTISDKKDVGSGESNDSKRKNCKVTYKDVTSSYSDYDTKKKKPKMKCFVCNEGGGVTEECSYNGAGELTASFPSSSDISSIFGRDSGDHSFYNPTDGFDGFHDLFF